MKKSIILLLFSILFASSIFTGCKDLLTEEKLGEPTADAYFNTKQGYLDLINSSYTQLRSQITGGGFGLMEYGTDLWENASDVEANEFNTYLPTLNSGNRFIYSLWSSYYTGIAVCNTAIGRAAKPVTGMTDAEVTAKKAEAHLLRAWYYSVLVMNFGDIPKITDEVTTVVTTATRAPQEEIFDLIFDDLEFAEANLPPTQSDYGRANKFVAKALLARIHLWHKDYTQAESYAKEVIANTSYQLQSTYAKLWDQDNQVNNEIIWAIQFSTNPRINSPSNALCLYFTPRYDLSPGMTRALIYSRPYPRYMATRRYLDLMNSERWRDSRYVATHLEYYMANYEKTLPAGMKLGDTAVAHLPYAVTAAFRASKKYKIYDINDNFRDYEISYGTLQQFIAMTKYHDKYRDAINSGSGTRDVFEIRLAEMYLIAAEALIMQTPSKPAEALPYVNAIRTRAAVPGKVADMQATLADMNIDYILRERALELGGERYRWIDLKRTGKLIEYAKAWNPITRNNIQTKHLLRPIPQDFIDRLSNKAEFINNPGY